MDGVTYKVRVKVNTLRRSFHIDDGDNAGTLMSGRYARDIVGTYYDYSMEVEPDPSSPGDYDAFYTAISAPVDSHMISVPFGQETMQFEAMVTSGSDQKKDRVGGITRWTGLSVNFTAIEPKRVPT